MLPKAGIRNWTVRVIRTQKITAYYYIMLPGTVDSIGWDLFVNANISNSIHIDWWSNGDPTDTKSKTVQDGR